MDSAYDKTMDGIPLSPGSREETAGGSGWWILLVGLALTQISTLLALAPPFHGITYPDHGFAPNYADVFWHNSLRRDVISGFLQLLGVGLSVGLSLKMWKRYFIHSHMNLWMSLLWAYGTSWGIIVWFRTRDLFDFANAQVPWATNDDYLSAKMWGQGIYMAIFFVFMLTVMLPIQRRHHRREAELKQEIGATGRD